MNSADAAGLEREFHDAMRDIYLDAKREADYTAARFIQMVGEHGGLETARRLLAIQEPSIGWTHLYERGRLDLSVECLVLQPRFEPLFTAEQREIARRWLRDYDFDPAQCETDD